MAEPNLKQLEDEVREISEKVKRIEQKLESFDFTAFKSSWEHFMHEMGNQKGHLMYQQIDDIQNKVAAITTHLDSLVRNVTNSAASMNSTSNEFFQLKAVIQGLSNKIVALEGYFTRISNPQNVQPHDLDGYRNVPNVTR